MMRLHESIPLGLQSRTLCSPKLREGCREVMFELQHSLTTPAALTPAAGFPCCRAQLSPGE